MKRKRSNRKSVLLFESDIELAKNIKLFLEDTFFVKLIMEQKELLSEINLGTYDFLVLDFNILNLGSRNLIEKIRLISPSTKILLMCTFFDAEVKEERFILSKVDDYIFKPFNVSLLQHKLSRISESNKKVNLSKIKQQ